MQFTDLVEVKKQLEIDPENQQEDAVLLLLIEQLSSWIEVELNRQFAYRSRTQYYPGSGTQKLLLRARPVYTNPLPVVYLDEGGFFGSVSGSFDPGITQLTWGNDFCLSLDWDSNGDGVDDASKSGILVRINDFWPKPAIRQGGYLSPFIGPSFGTLKIVYTAGYTIDSLPAEIRLAFNLLMSKARYLLPLGIETQSDGWEERSLSILHRERTWLMQLVWPFLRAYRNWKW